jgi:hypothetical protein
MDMDNSTIVKSETNNRNMKYKNMKFIIFLYECGTYNNMRY